MFYFAIGVAVGLVLGVFFPSPGPAMIAWFRRTFKRNENV